MAVSVPPTFHARGPNAESLAGSADLFRHAFDHAPIGMALVALDGRFLSVNRSLCRIVGYSEAELLAVDFQTITHPDDLDADLGLANRLLAGEIESYDLEKRYLHKLGHVVWVRLSGSLVRDDDGHPRFFVAQIQDVTARKRVEESLRAANARLATLIENFRDAVLVADEHRAVLLADDEFCRTFGLAEPPQSLAGLDCADVTCRIAAAFPEPVAFAARALDLVAGRRAVLNERLTLADGRALERDYHPIFVGSDYRGHVWTYRDVTRQVEADRQNEDQTRRLREANRRLETLAATDPLTGLLNRRAFLGRLDDEVARAGREGRPVSVVLLDVDRFKAFNDDFGHPAGDDALRSVARLLAGTVRPCDAVARYGGEEFAVLLPGADAADAAGVAERCRQTLAGSDWPLRSVTASFGVSTAAPPPRSDGDLTTRLIADADAALYRSKAAGRDRVTHAGELPDAARPDSPGCP